MPAVTRELFRELTHTSATVKWSTAFANLLREFELLQKQRLRRRVKIC